jgi:hypothetical protein
MCEQHCNHDLARGIGVRELLSGDGPFSPSYLIVNLAFDRAALFNTDRELSRRAAGAG